MGFLSLVTTTPEALGVAVTLVVSALLLGLSRWTT